MQASRFFTREEQQQILSAIKEAETNSSGEIRVHLESRCPEDVLDRAAWVFEKLNMHKTRLRNGVLFYLAIDDKKFAILGDTGINAVTPGDFWERIKDRVIGFFQENQFVTGLEEGIRMTGQALKEYFPYRDDDINELPDEISTGEI